MDIKNKKKYLRKGKYLVLKNNLIIRFSIQNIFLNKRTIIKSILKNDVILIQIKTESSSKVIGDKLVYRELDGSFLLFDSVRKNIYRKYADINQVKSIKLGISTLNILYDINEIKFLSENISQETFLSGKTLTNVSKEEQLQVFEKIINRYAQNFQSQNYPLLTSRISSSDFFKELELTTYPKEMKRILIDNKKRVIELIDNLIWTWSHSDLTPNNIMVYNNLYKIIDIERCEPMPAFYDVINLIFTMILLCENNELYLNYLNGKYDFLLKKTLKVSALLTTDRKLILLIMLSLKSIVAWDSSVKKTELEIYKNRWLAVKNQMLL